MEVMEVSVTEVEATPPVLDLTAVEIAELADELSDYHAEFADLYYRVEQAHWGEKYLQGLMLPIERKSIQPMALALEGGNIQAMQQFIGQGRWCDAELLAKHQQLVAETLGEADGVFIVDESGFPKKGDHSVGVARQWCGALGKVDNCQVGVFVGYASRQGYTLLDRQLYLPEEWFSADYGARRQKCAIPEETTFQTKPEIALRLLERMVAEASLPGRWVAADEGYGDVPAFLDRVAELGLWYFAEVSVDTRVWSARPRTAVPAGTGRGRRPTRPRLVPGEPQPVRVDALTQAIPASVWHPYQIKEGSRGPLVAEFALQRVVTVREGLPGPEVWLVCRRSLGPDPQVKYYLSNGPAHLQAAVLVRIAGMRWPIETAIEEGKGGLGMDHYEVRSWTGWHHHMTLCLLAHHFLVRTQDRLKKKPRP
jgi:SRSO17 transposase